MKKYEDDDSDSDDSDSDDSDSDDSDSDDSDSDDSKSDKYNSDDGKKVRDFPNITFLHVCLVAVSIIGFYLAAFC